jgi:hypothetical protein
MATLQELETALVNADRAGDAESARVLAAEVMRMRSEQPRASSALAPIGAVASGVNKGALSLAGLPMDTLANAVDLAKIPLGVAYREMTGNAVPDALAPFNRESIPLTSAWLQNQVRRTSAGRDAIDAGAGQFPMLHAGGAAIGASAMGGMSAPNALRAFAAGAIGQRVNEATGSPGASMLAAMAPYSGPLIAQATSAAQQAARPFPSINPAARATLSHAQEAGYVVPPSQAGRPSLIEGIGGKVKTAQTASARNQAVTNRLAAQALGLPEDTPINPILLGALRRNAGKAYDEVAKAGGRIIADNQYIDDLINLSKSAQRIRADFPDAPLAGADKIEALTNGMLRQSFSASSAIEYVKKLRADANKNLSWQNQADPERLALGHAQKAAAEALDNVIERNLAARGQTRLMSDYRAARTYIAKTYTVENALNEATGNVVARKLIPEVDKLTGQLRTTAQFAQAFPKANQPVEGIGGIPSISPLDVYGSAGAAALGTGTFGIPGGLAGAGLPLARNIAVPVALSRPMQRRLIPAELAPTWLDILRMSQAQKAGFAE